MINGVDFWQSVDEDIQDAMIGARPVKAYVDHDDGRRVTLRFQGSETVGQQRYPRLAGPDLAPGTPVYCLRLGQSGRRLIVLGAISDGEWDGGISEVDWSDILNKPSTFPPAPHNHDGRYYTQTEVDEMAPVIARGIGPSTIVASTAGRYWNDNASFTVSGLVPSYTYTVKCDIEIRTSGSGVRFLSQVARAVGVTTVYVSGNQGKYHRNDGDATMASNVIRVRPDSNGEIVFTPGIQQLSGTVSVDSTVLTVTLV